MISIILSNVVWVIVRAEPLSQPPPQKKATPEMEVHHVLGLFGAAMVASQCSVKVWKGCWDLNDKSGWAVQLTRKD